MERVESARGKPLWLRSLQRLCLPNVLSNVVLANVCDGVFLTDGKKDKDEPKPLDLLRDRTIFLSSLLYGLLAMTALVSNELFPLWVCC